MLAFVILTGCGEKKIKPISLPQIPERILKEPSGLAYDGEAFYIADWKGGGVLKLEPDEARAEWIAVAERPIQIAAAGRKALFIETYEGKLLYWKKDGHPSLRPLRYEFTRRPGSPFCWDGLYLWMAQEHEAAAALRLANDELIALPETGRPMPRWSDAGSDLLSFACGWMQSAALLQYGTTPRWALALGVLEGRQEKSRAWAAPALQPLAITWINSQNIVVLAERMKEPGMFELVLWN